VCGAGPALGRRSPGRRRRPRVRRTRLGGGRGDRRRPRHGPVPPPGPGGAGPTNPHLGLECGGVMRLTCTVNGSTRTADDVWPGESLLFTLRERMGLPGTKNACEQGECGSCTVLLDGLPVCSCLVSAPQAQGRDVVTVEGVAGTENLHPVQEAFIQ